jgi:predicted HTH domain antitoxin
MAIASGFIFDTIVQMIVSMDVPDPLAKQLHLDGEQGNKRALEMVALEGYRTGDLTRGKVGELLGLSFYETEEFLKKNGAEIKQSLEEFHRSSAALERLISR